MPLFSRLRALTQGDSSVVEEHSLPHPPHLIAASSQLQLAGLPTPSSDVISLSQHYLQIARVLQSFMPPTCRLSSLEDVKPIGDHPIAAGGVADIWEAVYDGRKVVLKSYRCYVTFDVAWTVEVHCYPPREVLR